MAKSSLLRALYANDRDVQKIVDASLNCLEVEQHMVDMTESAFQGAGLSLQGAGIGRVARKHHQPIRIVLDYGNVLQVARMEDPVLVRAGGRRLPKGTIKVPVPVTPDIQEFARRSMGISEPTQAQYASWIETVVLVYEDWTSKNER